MIAGAAALDTLTAPERASMEVLGRQTFEICGDADTAFRLCSAVCGGAGKRDSNAYHKAATHAPTVRWARSTRHSVKRARHGRRWERARRDATRRRSPGIWAFSPCSSCTARSLPYWADDLRRAPARWRTSRSGRPRGGGRYAQDRVVRVGRLPLLALEGDWAEARAIAASDLRQEPHLPPAGGEHPRRDRPGAGGYRAGARWSAAAAGRAGGEPGGTWHFDALRLQRLAADAGARRGRPRRGARLAGGARPLAGLERRGPRPRRGAARPGPAITARRATSRRRASTPSAALAHATEPRQPLALLAAHRLLGELATDGGQHADARAHLDAALALADACAAPYERALTLLALAELRRPTGNDDAARARAGRGPRHLHRLGRSPALARVRRARRPTRRDAATPPRRRPPARPLSGAADRARGGGAAPRRGGPEQPRDGRGPRPQRAHHRAAPREPLPQDRRAQPRRRHRLRPPPPPRLSPPTPAWRESPIPRSPIPVNSRQMGDSPDAALATGLECVVPGELCGRRRPRHRRPAAPGTWPRRGERRRGGEWERRRSMQQRTQRPVRRHPRSRPCRVTLMAARHALRSFPPWRIRRNPLPSLLQDRKRCAQWGGLAKCHRRG